MVYYFTNIFSILRNINPEQSRLIAEQLLDAFTQRIGPIIMRTVDIKFVFLFTNIQKEIWLKEVGMA
jgi:hypothetical protein